MLINGFLSCCSPYSMMLQGFQFSFLFFIHQRAFTARTLTFEFSRSKRYNTASSPPHLFKGDPVFFLGPGIKGNYENVKTRGLNVEERTGSAGRGCFTITLIFLCPQNCMNFLWVHFG